MLEICILDLVLRIGRQNKSLMSKRTASVCPKSLHPIYLVTLIDWVTTFWTYCIKSLKGFSRWGFNLGCSGVSLLGLLTGLFCL